MLDRAIALDPLDTSAYLNKGNAFTIHNNMLKTYKCSITDALTNNNKGSSLNNLQEYDEAIKMLNEAIKKLYPNYALAYLNKGIGISLTIYPQILTLHKKKIELYSIELYSQYMSQQS